MMDKMQSEQEDTRQSRFFSLVHWHIAMNGKAFCVLQVKRQNPDRPADLHIAQSVPRRIYNLMLDHIKQGSYNSPAQLHAEVISQPVRDAEGKSSSESQSEGTFHSSHNIVSVK